MHERCFSDFDFRKIGEDNLCHEIIPSNGLCIFCKINVVDVKYVWEACPVKLEKKKEEMKRSDMAKMLSKIFWIWKENK
jgi:hypothetical protein